MSEFEGVFGVEGVLFWAGLGWKSRSENRI